MYTSTCSPTARTSYSELHTSGPPRCILADQTSVVWLVDLKLTNELRIFKTFVEMMPLLSLGSSGSVAEQTSSFPNKQDSIFAWGHLAGRKPNSGGGLERGSLVMICPQTQMCFQTAGSLMQRKWELYRSHISSITSSKVNNLQKGWQTFSSLALSPPLPTFPLAFHLLPHYK